MRCWTGSPDAPPAFASVVEAVAFRARTTPGEVALRFEDAPTTWGELGTAVDRFAAALLRRGVTAGERVVAALPNGPEFFAAFYGAQRAGAVPVPVFPSLSGERVLRIAQLCEARAVVVPADAPCAAEVEAGASAAGREALDVVRDGMEPAGVRFPEPRPEDVGYIQYTSGSTGSPKGVQLSHGNLLANVGQLAAGMEVTPDDVYVSWLPAFHDMGLVVMTMVPFCVGARLVLLRTDLRRPARWLEAIARYRGTFTAAPDFAYRMCLRYVRDHARYDLRSLRVAMNAAEPVRLATVREFEAAFGLRGVMTAGYGMAEATVGVSMSAPGRGITFDAHGHASVGPPFPGVEAAILGDGALAAPGEMGEILVRGPAVTRGYFGNPAETARLFWRDGYLRTGDRGYLDRNGHLTVAGRIKETIKLAGRTLSPREIEEIVEQVPGVRSAVAIGVDSEGAEGEQVWVIGEIRPQDLPGEGERERAAIAVTERLHRVLGLRPARVVLTRPGTIPRTANGKVQRTLLREGVADGALARSGRVVFPSYGRPAIT
jgi:acyl-CoA synthetase (AMP-forming)/AMP-acid ligase II